MQASLIGLDMGASGWRAAVRRDGSTHRIRHRLGEGRIPPFVHKSIAPALQGRGDVDLGVDNYKRFLGRPARRAIIGEPSIRQWLARRLAALREDACADTGATHLGIVIPLPSCFRDRERYDVAAAARDAGFVQVEIPDETVLVADHVLSGRSDHLPALYVHMGAGTFGLSVLTSRDGGGVVESASAGTFMLGGDDFDVYLMHVILANACEVLRLQSVWDLRRFADERLRSECEEMRKRLTSGGAKAVHLNVERFQAGAAAMPPRFELTVNPAVLEKTVQPLTDRISQLADELAARMAEAGIARGDLRTVLVGGAAAQGMPLLWQGILSDLGISGQLELIPAAAYVEAAAAYAAQREPRFIEEVLAQRAEPPRPVVVPYDPAADERTSEVLAGSTGSAVETPARREPSSTPADADLPDIHPSRWAAKYGEWIAQAEQMHRQDPSGSVRALTETAARLLDLASQIGSKAPECGPVLLPLNMLTKTADTFMRSDALEPVAGIGDPVAAAAYEPTFGAILAAAQALCATGDPDGAHRALDLAATWMRKEYPPHSRTRDADVLRRGQALRGLLFQVRVTVAYREAEQFVARFERRCAEARRADPLDRRRDCESAVRELQQAVGRMDAIARLFRDAGARFDGTRYDEKRQRWQLSIKECRDKIGR